MMNIASPRKKSNRGSRGVLAAVDGNAPVFMVMRIPSTQRFGYSDVWAFPASLIWPTSIIGKPGIQIGADNYRQMP
jgi:hypothetical protein